MKTAFLLFVVAMCIAAIYADCDPDAQGMPDCATLRDAAGTKYRNNWDPTHYFVCDGIECISVSCQNSTGFQPSTKECVGWNIWTWEPVC